MKSPDLAAPTATVSRRVAVALGLVGLALYLLKDALFLGGAYAERDLSSVYIPDVEAFVRAISEGALPFRTPATGFGQPMLGNPDAQIPYPTTWLHLFMLPDRVYPIFLLIHYALGAIGAGALAWRFSRSLVGSAFAGAFWLVSGPFQSFLTLWHHLAGAAWMPWVLIAFDRLLEKTDRRTISVLASIFGAQILAGSADMCAMTLALACLRLLSEARAGARFFGQLSAAAMSLIIALSLGAVTWLTAGEVLLSSDRTSLSEEARLFWAVHPALLPELAMPLGLGSLNLVPDANDLLFEGREPFVKSLFLGPLVVPLLLAALVSPSVAPRFRLFCGFGILGSLFVSLGNYSSVYGLITTLAPVLKIFRYPSKALIPASLLMCVLAGIGVACLKSERGRRIAGAAAMVLILLHAGLLLRVQDVLARLIDSADPEVLRLAARHVGFELALSAGALILLATALAFRRPAVVMTATAASLIVTISINARLNEVVPTHALRFRPDEVLAAVKTSEPSRLYVSDYVFSRERSRRLLGKATPFEDARVSGLPDLVARKVAYRSLLVPPVGAAWGVEYAWDTDLRSLFHTTLRQTTTAVGALEGTSAFLRLLQIANVSHVAALHNTTFTQLHLERTLQMPTREPLYLYRVPDPLPRAYAVSGVKVLPVAAAARELVNPAFHPVDEVILDTGTPSDPSGTFRSKVTIIDRRADRIVLEATLNEPGSVVLLEGFLPGWHVTVDGVAAPVLRANAFFVAVSVAAGKHAVVFSYRPWTAVVGTLLSLLTALALAVSLVGRQRAGGLTVPK